MRTFGIALIAAYCGGVIGGIVGAIFVRMASCTSFQNAITTGGLYGAIPGLVVFALIGIGIAKYTEGRRSISQLY